MKRFIGAMVITVNTFVITPLFMLISLPAGLMAHWLTVKAETKSPALEFVQMALMDGFTAITLLCAVLIRRSTMRVLQWCEWGDKGPYEGQPTTEEWYVMFGLSKLPITRKLFEVLF